MNLLLLQTTLTTSLIFIYFTKGTFRC